MYKLTTPSTRSHKKPVVSDSIGLENLQLLADNVFCVPMSEILTDIAVQGFYLGYLPVAQAQIVVEAVENV